MSDISSEVLRDSQSQSNSETSEGYKISQRQFVTHEPWLLYWIYLYIAKPPPAASKRPPMADPTER